jgi:hypothetical protein
MITFNDEYLEKMGTFYTSELAKQLFPDIQQLPFKEWIEHQYNQKLEGLDGQPNRHNRNYLANDSGTTRSLLQKVSSQNAVEDGPQAQFPKNHKSKVRILATKWLLQKANSQ